MSVINVEHISKLYGDKLVLEDLSCSVDEGDKIGIIGINGTGKSTLLRIIAGEEEADEGKIIFSNGLTVGWLGQNPEFDEDSSILKYVCEGKKIEEDYAKTETPVVSNNSAHRWTPDVPMIVPEVNPEHLEVIESQKKRLGTKRGFICVKPNCSIQSYAPALTAWRKFEPTLVVATTYQAISGAGKTFKDWPEMEHNIIPYIGGEEEKSEQEPLRIWGKVENGQIVKADGPLITSQCIRVPVLDGHTAAVFVNFKQKPTKEELIQALVEFKGAPQELGLPNAPKQFIQYLEEDDRPQVALDVNYENGFGVSIGRLRKDAYFDWKFVGLSHNTVRGAAGGAVLMAELLKAKGYITAK